MENYTGRWYKKEDRLPTISDELYNDGFDTRGVPAHLVDGSLVIAWFCVEDQRFYNTHSFPQLDITDKVEYWFDLPDRIVPLFKGYN